MRGLALLALLGIAVAAQASRGPDVAALGEARKEADAANARSQELERQARAATSAAARARAEGEALASRIEAAEADLTAAERRIAIIARLQEAQQARLAARQGPLVRLVAALQTMARRPPALALVQPGSVQDTVRVRALLAATLPEIRRRTAALRTEVNYADALRARADQAQGALRAGREALAARRTALAAFESDQRSRSSTLAGLSLTEGDRALALGEEARAMAQTIDRGAEDARRANDLGSLSGPSPRPGSEGEPARPRLPYVMPVRGRLLTGVGEISDSGVHSRGLTLATPGGAQAVAPANGRIVYAAPFRAYGNVLIIDHGRGWTTVITGLATLDVTRGATVARGAPLGRAAANAPRVTVELRHGGRPVPLAQLLSG
ncbi:murein hydrolase activator EnvC family protein [Sphingosinicella sp.]|uniref:murein hydrolase activator EnvC family protein n=1 Tax=Sphingosinicella sp. TaxID=1917971 RepID=UPI0040379085